VDKPEQSIPLIDFDPETFRRLGYRVIDMLAEYYADLPDAPVFPPRTPAEVAPLFDRPAPQEGEPPDGILDDWATKVLPNSTRVGSPRYFGFVMGSGTMMGTFAEALAASLNANVGAWKPAPAATEIERRTIAWLAELIGYPEGGGGLFTSGGTMANFTALLTALRNVAPYDTTEEGLQVEGLSPRFRVYMTDHEGHVSITRVADLMNLGRAAVRRVPSHDDFTMDLDALQRMLDEDHTSGATPFCVVGQAGSINVGAIDPLDGIARICEDRGIWFHVDGACGAAGAMLPEKRPLYRGLERADSVTLDPHKWLYVPYECGCVLVQEPEKLRRAFSMHAPYLRGTLPTEYTGFDYFDYGPQMSRGFRALKVWMMLRYYGADGYRALLRQNIRCAEHLDRLVRASVDFEALQQPTLFIYSFRYLPAKYQQALDAGGAEAEATESYLDRLNQRIADAIQLSGFAFLMTTKVRGRTVLRLSISSHRTRPADIEQVFLKLREIGEEVDASGEAL